MGHPKSLSQKFVIGQSLVIAQATCDRIMQFFGRNAANPRNASQTSNIHCELGLQVATLNDRNLDGRVPMPSTVRSLKKVAVAFGFST